MHLHPQPGLTRAALRSAASATRPRSCEQKHTPFDAGEAQLFGYSVALSGDTAVVGVHGDDERGPGSGAAYVIPLPEPSALAQRATALLALICITRFAPRRQKTGC